MGYPLREFRSVLSDFKDLSALAFKGIIVAPVSAVWLNSGLPFPALTALVTSIFVLVTQIWVFQIWCTISTPKLKRRMHVGVICLGISLIGFLFLVGLFTVEPGTGRDRVVEGWVVRSDVKPLLNSGYTAEDALHDSRYDAKQVWTSSSVAFVTAILQLTWLVAFTSFAALVSSFIVLQRRREHFSGT